MINVKVINSRFPFWQFLVDEVLFSSSWSVMFWSQIISGTCWETRYGDIAFPENICDDFHHNNCDGDVHHNNCDSDLSISISVPVWRPMASSFSAERGCLRKHISLQGKPTPTRSDDFFSFSKQGLTPRALFWKLSGFFPEKYPPKHTRFALQ